MAEEELPLSSDEKSEFYCDYALGCDPCLDGHEGQFSGTLYACADIPLIAKRSEFSFIRSDIPAISIGPYCKSSSEFLCSDDEIARKGLYCIPAPQDDARLIRLNICKIYRRERRLWHLPFWQHTLERIAFSRSHSPSSERCFCDVCCFPGRKGRTCCVYLECPSCLFLNYGSHFPYEATFMARDKQMLEVERNVHQHYLQDDLLKFPIKYAYSKKRELEQIERNAFYNFERGKRIRDASKGLQKLL